MHGYCIRVTTLLEYFQISGVYIIVVLHASFMHVLCYQEGEVDYACMHIMCKLQVTFTYIIKRNVTHKAINTVDEVWSVSWPL